MPTHKCADCDRHGRLGNVNRTYVVQTPTARTEMVLCFPCFTTRDLAFGKSRKQWIRDRVHLRAS